MREKVEIDREELARLRADSAELARVRGITVISKILPELDKASSFASQLVGTACRLDPRKHYRIDFVMLGEPAEIKQSIPEGFALVPVEVQRDAERYRWLRNPDQDVSLVIDKVTGEIPADEFGCGGYRTYEYRAGDELDSAIDAAMLATAPKGDSHD